GPGGGTALGAANAGTNPAFRRVRNGGSLPSQTVDGAADVVAAAVNLTAPEGGNFGTSAASPLEIDATTLSADVMAAAGSVNVLDTAGGPDGALGQAGGGCLNHPSPGRVLTRR